ncbi:SDR family oxidoreductase [Chitinophaga sp. CF418]|uniref:SDR family oxidoreductase n=1 Tax=Chitinophaga sp. CF418 TaxID=1855287 RepID=UPI00091C01C6|nr:SDR family oxidoreductase [Chitinophaga sp. CF418]SHN44020.1 NAD(P)H dehydrogenase (quinone) [Chitinophaga sp. CF418]
MILLTGATGHLGRYTMEYLMTKNITSPIAVMARDASLNWNDIDVRMGDYNDFPTLVHAFKGVDTLLFISTNATENRLQQHANVLRAAKENDVKHIVYTSMLNASETSTFEPAIDHFHTEELLKQTGIPYTIFRNAFYGEIIPMLMGDALQTGTWYYPAGNAKVNFVARKNIAEALANVMANPAMHKNKTYEIASRTSYTFSEIAGLLSSITDKPIVYIPISLETMRQGMQQSGIPLALINLIVSGADAILKGETDITDDCLEMLLDRKPLDLKDYLPELLGKMARH